MSYGRFHRSTREAFPSERFPAIEVYRRPWAERFSRLFGWLVTFGLLAFLGVLLAIRG
jgi:hypothetical protein